MHLTVQRSVPGKPGRRRWSEPVRIPVLFLLVASALLVPAPAKGTTATLTWSAGSSDNWTVDVLALKPSGTLSVSEVGSCSTNTAKVTSISCTTASSSVPSGTTDLVATFAVTPTNSGGGPVPASPRSESATVSISDTCGNGWTIPAGSSVVGSSTTLGRWAALAVVHLPSISSCTFTVTWGVASGKYLDYIGVHVLAVSGTAGLDTNSPSWSSGTSSSLSATTGTLSASGDFVVGTASTKTSLALTAGQTKISGTAVVTEWTTGPSGGGGSAATPTFSPGAGTYSSAQSVTISTISSGAIICWNTTGSPKTNGTTGCTTGTLYSGLVTVSSSETLYAVAGGTGYTDSSVGSASYTINGHAATPTFSPGAGTYSSAQSVTVSTTSSNAIICWNTTGSPGPINGGTSCPAGSTLINGTSGMVNVSASETLYAIAGGTGYTDSTVGSASYTISGPTIYYYIEDSLGSSRVITDSSGNLCYDADFYPFGGERAYATACSQNYKFTGKERDPESGLDNFGARYNSSQMGRFISPDPKRDSAIAANPQTLNRYAYALDSPMRYVDAAGECVSPALGPGQVGICIEAYIRAARLGFLYLGIGDRRGPVANDPKATFREQTLITVDLAKQTVSETWSPGKSSVILNGLDPKSGIASSDLSGIYVDKAGNVHFTVEISALNGQAASGGLVGMFAPSGTINMAFEFLVDPKGTVILLGGRAKTFPSISIFSYSNGSINDLFEQTESGHSSDLNKPMQNIPSPKSADSSFQQMNGMLDEFDCDAHAIGCQ